MPWFSKKKPKLPPLVKSPTVYVIDLHHENGTVITLRDVVEEHFQFLKENVGRDAIYTQDEISVNLRNFCIVQTQKLPETGKGDTTTRG